MTAIDAAIPDGFDYIDLAELLDVIDSLLVYVSGRLHTSEEQEGENQTAKRAIAVLGRYRCASV